MANKKQITDKNQVTQGTEATLQQQKALDEIANRLTEKERQLTQESARLTELKIQLDSQQAEAQNGFPSLLAAKFESYKSGIEAREKALLQQTEALQRQQTALAIREKDIALAEARRDDGFSQERQALETQLAESRRQAEVDLVERRQKRYQQLERDIDAEREQRQGELQRILKQQRDDFEQQKQSELDELKHRAEQLKQLQARLDEQAEDNEYQGHRLKSRADNLAQREAALEAEVERLSAARQQSFIESEARLKNECERLREALKMSEHTLGLFEQLKHQLDGKDPEVILADLKTLEMRNNELKQQLLEGPTEQMQQLYGDVKEENTRLSEHNEQLLAQNKRLTLGAQDQDLLQMQLDGLTARNLSLNNQCESLEADCNRMRDELKRLRSSYERQQDRDERINDIQLPYIKELLARSTGAITELQALAIDEPGQYSELQWLENIYRSCQDYGLTFHKRILYAFHTALKTAEWSSLTVLSGVSGTGKSELPRLYSHFGGVNFLSLAVQPNWDSQESMLGFFNAIDNKFDAQPVLRLLAQSQQTPPSEEDSDDYPGLNDTLCLILLDEMNLAHVELYFAEFLSKLELRRGKRKNQLPCLDVKLGAGISPYELPLGRNVLWAGTMNQDETTKSLSDKVLDRSTAIYFPRPTRLHRRQKLKSLDNPAPLLLKKTWSQWCCTESRFKESEIKPFRAFVEKINEYLAVVGMALGHRVWQSIEYYMANYPTVLHAQRNKDEEGVKQAMKMAFEDQLVQKVMPKLRGIETRGSGKTDCLDKIREMLDSEGYHLVGDFDLACRFGYGQFIWNSANYLKADDVDEGEKDETAEQVEAEKSQTLPTEQTAAETKPSAESGITVSGVTDEQLQKLQDYCDKQNKPLNELSEREIKHILNCYAEQAKAIKKALG